jgi:UDP-glucose 4-epimerase
VKLIVERPLESLLRNVRGIDIVTDAAARHGNRLLFTSTSEIYGKNSTGALREGSDRLLGPASTSRWSYATAKTLGEMLVFGYFRERNAEMIVARLFNTVGPRQRGFYGMVLPRFVEQALRGEELTVYGDGTQSRCFAHVSDTVDALITLGDSDLALGGVYNIGRDTEITILELAELVIERVGSDSTIRFVPYVEAYENGFEELGRRQPDTSAIQALTGWRAQHTIAEAIDDVIAYQHEEVARSQLAV